MDEPQEVGRVVFVAHDQSAEVAQPGEEAFHLPPASVAAQRAAILGLGSGPIPPVGSDQFYPLLAQGGIQPVRVVRPVTDKPLGER